MVNFCAVFGCTNRSNRETGKSFFRIPKVVEHEGAETRELSKKRRDKWISMLSRIDSDLSSPHHRVCSDHFLSGKPSSLYEVQSPDWAPSLNLGHGILVPCYERYKRQKRGRKLKMQWENKNMQDEATDRKAKAIFSSVAGTVKFKDMEEITEGTLGLSRENEVRKMKDENILGLESDVEIKKEDIFEEKIQELNELQEYVEWNSEDMKGLVKTGVAENYLSRDGIGSVENKNNIEINDKIYRLEREVEVKQDEDFVEIKEEIEEMNEFEGFIEQNPENVNGIKTGMEQHELSEDNTGNECKQRWVSLRDQYRRYLRMIATKSGQEAASKGKYKYADEMSFVKPFLRERETVTNQENDEASVATEDVEATEEDDVVPQKKQKCSGGGDQLSIGEKCSEQESTCETKETVRTPSRRSMKPPETADSMLMKYLVENDKEEKPTDPIDLFFQTMAATVKKFSPYYQNMCKTKVFSIVSEFETTQILEQISPAASATPTPGYTTVPATKHWQ